MMNRITNESPVKGESCLSFAAVDADEILEILDARCGDVLYYTFECDSRSERRLKF